MTNQKGFVKILIILVLVAIVAGAGYVVLKKNATPVTDLGNGVDGVSGKGNDTRSPYLGWPPEDNYECNSDSDCVSLACAGSGSLTTHKNALKYLDEFREKFCDPVISYENVLCSKTYKSCVIPQGGGDAIHNDLLKPSLPPNSPQPFSDD